MKTCFGDEMTKKNLKSNRGFSIHWSAARDYEQYSETKDKWKKKAAKKDRSWLMKEIQKIKKKGSPQRDFIKSLITWTIKKPLTQKQRQAAKKIINANNY